MNNYLDFLHQYLRIANLRPLIYLIPVLASVFFLGAGHDDTWIMLFAGETLGKGSWFLNHNGVPQEISTSVLGAILAGAAAAIAPNGEEYAFWKIMAWLPALLAAIAVFEILRKHSGQVLAAYWTLVLFCVPQWHYWAFGGVESGLFWLGVVLFAYSLATFSIKPSWRAGLIVAAVAAMLPLVRADALWAPLLLLYFVVFQRGAPLILRLTPWLLATGFTLAFHVVRHAMTGAWFPNPVYAKSAMSLESISHGMGYLIEFHTSSPLHVGLALSIPLSLLGVYRLLCTRAIASTIRSRLFEWSALLVLTIDLTTVMVGGDWMVHHRFAIRSLPLKILVLALWVHESIHTGALSNLSAYKKRVWAGIFMLVAVSGLTASGAVEQPHHRVRLAPPPLSQDLILRAAPWAGLSNLFIQWNGTSRAEIKAIRPWIERDLPLLVENARHAGQLPLKIASYQAGFFPRELRRHYSPEEILFVDLAGLSDYRVGRLPGARSAVGLVDGTYKWAKTFATKQGGLGRFLMGCQPDVVYVLSASRYVEGLMNSAGYKLAYTGWIHRKGERALSAANVFVWNQQKQTGACPALV